MNELQANCCILWIDIAWGLQKLGIILENKVSPNFKLAKNCINENLFGFIYRKKVIKRYYSYTNRHGFDMKNWLEFEVYS